MPSDEGSCTIMVKTKRRIGWQGDSFPCPLYKNKEPDKVVLKTGTVSFTGLR